MKDYMSAANVTLRLDCLQLLGFCIYTDYPALAVIGTLQSSS